MNTTTFNPLYVLGAVACAIELGALGAEVRRKCFGWYLVEADGTHWFAGSCEDISYSEAIVAAARYLRVLEG